MSHRKTIFNPEWEDANINPQWSPWLQAVLNEPYKARCRLCAKIFSLSNMGQQAIKSHEVSIKHVKSFKMYRSSTTIENYVKETDCKEKINQSLIATRFKSSETDHNHPQISNSPFVQKKSVSVEDFAIKGDNTLEAEIIWGMKLVCSHSSYNAFNDASYIFHRMFPDSNIAKSVSLGRTKMSYLVTFGIAPYFRQSLFSELCETEYVICFDEALNKISQRGQMDLFVRFWSSEENEVQTRYLTSLFLGHSTAIDLMEHFFKGISKLDRKKLLQISLDGPNVNLKFLRNVKDILAEEENCHLLDIGTCGLHVVHGAFRAGHRETGWDLNNLFRAFYRLFKDSPARRADFVAITGCTKFPLKFCEVRWLENISVGERIIEIISDIKKYIDNSELPQTVTTERIKEALKDKLILAKISFFISIAGVLHPFLKEFQTANPMSSFLYDCLHNLINQLMSRFIKPDILRNANTPEKCMKIDINDKNNCCYVTATDIGIAAGRYLAKSNVSDLQKREFQTQCQKCLIQTTQKIMERSSLNYILVRCISSLNPKLILTNELLSQKRMDRLLALLYEKQWITSILADYCKKEFCDLIFRAKGEWRNEFSSFKRSTRLDHFYRSLLLKDQDMFRHLWKIIKLILILSHGNATVESGFSINKEMLVENLQENSLIALRTVYDAVKSSGGILNVIITKKLLQYAKSSHSCYIQALQDKKKINEEEKKKEHEKRKAKDQIKLLKLKRVKLTQEAALETKTIDWQIAELTNKHLKKI